jgi:hypothetical protein
MMISKGVGVAWLGITLNKKKLATIPRFIESTDAPP